MADSKTLKIPNHVAMIMDGNGRWAKARHMPRTFGHAKGAERLEQVLEDCDSLGIKYLTVYAFSTENWSRPEEEVQVIMNLLKNYFIKNVEKCMKNNVRFRVIGERSRLNSELIAAIENLEEKTKNNTGITFIVAINYGSRDEITRAVKKMADDLGKGRMNPSEVSEQKIAGYLDTAEFPDPDLVIRTSGEERISNFLLWQLAYSELYFTEKAWPDFDKEELLKAIESYTNRDRRYGNAK